MKQFSALLTRVVRRYYSSLQHTISCFGVGVWGEEGVDLNDERDVNVEQQAFCQQFVRFLVSQSVCFFTPPLLLSFFRSSWLYADTRRGI